MVNEGATPGLGDAIRTARDRARLSTQAAAERARISPGYLNKLEAGRVGTPSPRVLHRLAEVIDVPYWKLMRLADYIPADAPEPSATPARATEQATNDRLLEVLLDIRAAIARLEAAGPA